MSRSSDPAGNAQASSLMADLRSGGVENTTAEEAAAPKRPKVSSATLTVAIVVAASGALLLGMRTFGLGPSLSIGDITVDYEPSTQADAVAKEHSRLMSVLARVDQTSPVPVDSLPKNPFRLGAQAIAVEASADPVDDGARDRERDQRAREERQHRIESALATLQLQSVLAGKVPVARINGATVQIGDVIDEVFTVTAISGRGVALTADGKTFNLDMPESSDLLPGSKPKKKN